MRQQRRGARLADGGWVLRELSVGLVPGQFRYARPLGESCIRVHPVAAVGDDKRYGIVPGVTGLRRELDSDQRLLRPVDRWMAPLGCRETWIRCGDRIGRIRRLLDLIADDHSIRDTGRWSVLEAYLPTHRIRSQKCDVHCGVARTLNVVEHAF